MVEGNRTRQISLATQPRGFRIVGAMRFALRRRDEYRRNGVMTRISVRIGVGVKLVGEIHRQRSFLRGFAHRSALDALTVIDKPPRQRPSVGRILSLDENNLAVDLDDDI